MRTNHLRRSMSLGLLVAALPVVLASGAPASAAPATTSRVVVDAGCAPATLGRGAPVTGRETDVAVSVTVATLDYHDHYVLAWPLGDDARVTPLRGPGPSGTLTRSGLPVRLAAPLDAVGTGYEVRSSAGTVVARGDVARAARPDAGCRVLGRLTAVRSLDPSGLNAFGVTQQSDGNVVERDGQGRALWSTGTAGHPGARLVLQSDGNVVIRDAAGRAIWVTGTAGHPGATLTLQTDDNVVLRDRSGRARWASGVHR